MKKLLCLIAIMLCATLAACSADSAKSRSFTTNQSYVNHLVPAYLNFYEDGTYEMVQFGTYKFDEKDGNRLIYLDYDEQEEAWAYADAYVITESKEGYLQLLPAVLFFESNTDQQAISESSINLTYSSVLQTDKDGIKDGFARFSGEYRFVIESVDADMSLAFYEEGFFVQRVTSEYEVSQNNQITMNNTKLDYEINDETGEFFLKSEDGQSAGTYVKATADNGIHYVIPYDGYCECDKGHKFIVVTTGVFETQFSDAIEENILYTAYFYTNDTEYSFSDLEATLVNSETEQMPDLCKLRVVNAEGSMSIGLFQTPDSNDSSEEVDDQ